MCLPLVPLCRRLTRTFLLVSRGYHSLNRLRIAAKPSLPPPVAVHTVIDGDKADIVARKNNIRILSNGQIVTPKAAEVFDQPTAHKTLLDKCKAFLHTGTIKVRSGITVIHQNFQVCIPMIMGISG